MSETLSIKELIEFKNQIESIDKFHHVKILYILKQYNIPFSENRNGIFVNITNLKKEVIVEIKKILEYIKTQEQQLKDVEQLKNKFKSDFFNSKVN